MQLLKIEVHNTHWGKHHFRVFGRNDAGQVLIGISENFEKDPDGNILKELVKKLETTQTHVRAPGELGSE